MATDPINIPIRTTYDGDGADEAIDDAEKLEKLDPTVEFDADTDKVDGAVDDMTASAKALMDRNPWVAEFMGDTSQLKSELEQAQAKLVETGNKADDAKRHLDKIGDTGGPRLAGNQVADLTGPLGDASGAASNLGGVFDGLADITEKVAGKVGLDAAKMASSVAGIGFVVAAGAAAWTVFRQKQEEAKKRAEEHLKLQQEITDAIKDGNREVAASKFVELYGDLIEDGRKAGLSIGEVVDGIRKSGDEAGTAQRKIDDLDRQISDLDQSYQDLHATTAASGAVPSGEEKALADQLNQLRDTRQGLIDAQTEWSNMTDEQKANTDLQSEVQTALLGTEESTDAAADAAGRAKSATDDYGEALDRLRGHLDIKRTMEDFETDITTAMNNVALGVAPTKEEIRSIEDTIFTVAEYAHLNPIEVQSLLDLLDNGQMADVLNKAQAYVDGQDAISVTVEAELNRKTLNDQLRQLQADMNAQFGNKATTSIGGTSATTVNVNLPRGARHGDIARAMNLSTRRNGRRYGNPSGTVSYARG